MCFLTELLFSPLFMLQEWFVLHSYYLHQFNDVFVLSSVLVDCHLVFCCLFFPILLQHWFDNFLLCHRPFTPSPTVDLLWLTIVYTGSDVLLFNECQMPKGRRCTIILLHLILCSFILQFKIVSIKLIVRQKECFFILNLFK